MTNPMPPEDMEMPMEMPMEAGIAEDVNISVPKSEFDKIHAMVVELASVLDAFKSSVDAEEQMIMEEEMPMIPPETDEAAELAAFAQELNTRSKV
jgi:hypothetical protein